MKTLFIIVLCVAALLGVFNYGSKLGAKYMLDAICTEHPKLSECRDWR